MENRKSPARCLLSGEIYMSDREIAELRRTAIHEAGHCVARFNLTGRAPDLVSIKQIDDSLGRNVFTGEISTHDDIIIAFGGPVASNRQDGSNNWIGAEHDLQKLHSLMDEVCEDLPKEDANEIRLAIWESFLADAEKLVADNWESISKVADALIASETKELNRAQIETILSGIKTNE